tara:strand:- start:15 stop:431 length:417 start_codon:yes stop_codon:yes gene_type:complete
MSYHVFYKSNKEIAWSTNADVSDQIKTEQADAGFSYVHTDLTDLPTPDLHYVNGAGDTVLAKTAFTPTFSTVAPTVDQVINVTGLPTGTKVYLDDVLQGTMSDTTLTLTTQEPGTYKIKFEKLEKLDFYQKIITEKQS